MPHRVERFSSTLKQCLAEILTLHLHNPRLSTIYISQVIATPDLKTARVFIAPLFPSAENSDSHEKDQLLSELTKAKGFIKKELGKRMYLKFVPELIFLNDETIVFNMDKV